MLRALRVRGEGAAGTEFKYVLMWNVCVRESRLQIININIRPSKCVFLWLKTKKKCEREGEKSWTCRCHRGERWVLIRPIGVDRMPTFYWSYQLIHNYNIIIHIIIYAQRRLKSRAIKHHHYGKICFKLYNLRSQWTGKVRMV